MSDKKIYQTGVCAVVGGAYGSEGKGLTVSRIGGDYKHHVRVGAANAGHTGWIDGHKVVSQQLPMAAWMAKGDPKGPVCYIGPGAVISTDILLRELHETAIPRERIVIDPRAHVISRDQINREAAGDLAERIGSASTIAREGIGTATADRVLRAANCELFADWIWGKTGEAAQMFHMVTVDDVPIRLAQVDSIMLEGTQGTGLSNTTGQFPFVTSRNTTSAGLCADAGVAPTRLNRVIGVFRTYPIRVSGNSGPFFADSRETTFAELGLEQEVTTVTKLPRRIATFSFEQVGYSVKLNGMTEIHITFMDYLHPEIYGLNDGWSKIDRVVRDDIMAFVGQVERAGGVPVTAIGTGPDGMIFF